MASLRDLCTQNQFKFKLSRWLLRFPHTIGIPPRLRVDVEFMRRKLKFVVPRRLIEPALNNLEHILINCDYFKLPKAVPKTGSIVLDAGSFLGFYAVPSSLLSGSSGKVIAVEPNPLVLGYLHTNLSLNKASSASIYPVALCAERGFTKLYVGEYASVSSTCREHVEKYTSVSNIFEVKCVRLSTLISRLGHVDILKLDVEGVELDIITEALPSLHMVDLVIAELHMDVIENAGEVEDLLNRAGFKKVFLFEVENSVDQIVLYAFR